MKELTLGGSLKAPAVAVGCMRINSMEDDKLAFYLALSRKWMIF